MLYFLDDDNIMHPDLIKFMDICENDTIYTFDQTNRLPGNNIELYRIDTACLLIDFSLCKDIRWIPSLYEADGHYIIENKSDSEREPAVLKNLSRISTDK